ncbi:hypothetical protein VTP01DRAFT_3861 [Rhizomucor pusillus]|uniref:uncharacterized protein n=1 Tax=Rhizomucor pusillus TaxID=4840 RepID=UPI003744A6DB
MDFKLLLLLLLTIVGHPIVGQETDEALYPYGSNPPRVNPDYCVGFNITYPVKPGKTYRHGEMAHLTWEVDPTVAIHPDLVTRIRVLNDKQRNIYAFGENISIYTYKNKGSVVFPMYLHDVLGQFHFRIMVNYPGTSLHCVYESVPFTGIPPPLQRYQALETPQPKWALPNAVPLVTKNRLEAFTH